MKADLAKSRFRVAFQRFHRSIFAFCYTKLSCREAAKEATQEVFTKAWQKYQENTETLQVERAWLLQIARNHMIDHWRRSKSAKHAVVDVPQSILFEASISPEEKVTKKQEVDVLQQEMKKLPDELRELLTLSVLGGMNSRELGEHFQQPAGTIRYKLRMARQQLAKRMKERGYEEHR